MIRTYNRGEKYFATSTYFDDMALLKQSRMDSKSTDLDPATKERLAISYVATLIKFWRYGCIELSEWAEKQPKGTKYTTVYKGMDLEESEAEL